MNLVERVLNSMQRKRRAVRLRQRQPKIQAQRERRKRHTASKSTLERRARKLARSMIRDRVAGKGKGAGYKKMNVSQKIVVDHMIDKYQDRINKLAKMLMPVVRRGEMTRMQSVHKTKGNTKLTGGVGRLHASYEENSEGQLISEEINDYRLERLLLAGLENKNNVQIFKRLLGDSVSYSRMEVYRKKLLKLLNHILDLITNDYQLYTRAEMVIRKKKLDEENMSDTVSVIKKVVSEALSMRTNYGFSSSRRSRIKTKGFRPTRMQRVPRGAKPVGRGGIKRVERRPAGVAKVGAAAAYKSADKSKTSAMSRARQLINNTRKSMRRTDKMTRRSLGPAGFRR